VVSVAATHEVEQAAALDEGSRGEEAEAWVDGIAHTPSPHLERIHEIPNRHLHLHRILCSLVASNAEVSTIYRAISGRLTEPNSSYHRRASIAYLTTAFSPRATATRDLKSVPAARCSSRAVGDADALLKAAWSEDPTCRQLDPAVRFLRSCDDPGI